MSAQAERAAALIDALAQAGIRELVISPGSRSTPFVLAASKHPDLRCHDVLDERAAAFFALGIARVTDGPALLLCTSGSAAAHYLPAVVEASEARLPLVILSADRPPELHDCGANQTTAQQLFFGDHVRFRADLGPPRATASNLNAARRLASQAVAYALHPDPGPVHLNAPAEKRLEPPADFLPAPSPAATRFYRPRSLPDPQALDDLAAAIDRATRPLLVAGPAPLSHGASREAAYALAKRCGMPLFAESASQWRLTGSKEAIRCDGFDAIARSTVGGEAIAPDLIVNVGAAPISAGYEALLRERAIPRYVLAPLGWPDPTSNASALIAGELEAILGGLLERLEGRSTAFAEQVAELDSGAARLRDETLLTLQQDYDRGQTQGQLNEGAVTHRLAATMPTDGLLMLGNSLAVRHMDTWVGGDVGRFSVLHQRGASGIDGLISGAAGAARASGKPTALLLGDLSFQHDLGGLALARELASPLVIVVIHNGGGRIFDGLPLGRRVDLSHAMGHFTMTQQLDLEAAAKAFGLPAARVETLDSLDRALGDAFSRVGASAIEARVPPTAAKDQADGYYAALERWIRER